MQHNQLQHVRKRKLVRKTRLEQTERENQASCSMDFIYFFFFFGGGGGGVSSLRMPALNGAGTSSQAGRRVGQVPEHLHCAIEFSLSFAMPAPRSCP